MSEHPGYDAEAEVVRLRTALEEARQEIRRRMDRFGRENRERPHSYLEGKEAGLHDAASILARALTPTAPVEGMTKLGTNSAPAPAVPMLDPGTPSKDFEDGRDSALANAAMLAYDMGHPDVRQAINQLIPEGSDARPIDTPPGLPRFGAVCGDAIEALSRTPPAPVTCDGCAGTGNVFYETNLSMETCGACNGTGRTSEGG